MTFEHVATGYELSIQWDETDFLLGGGKREKIRLPGKFEWIIRTEGGRRVGLEIHIRRHQRRRTEILNERCQKFLGSSESAIFRARRKTGGNGNTI